MLRPPNSYRNGIPFYAVKSEQQFRADSYENFAELVSRSLLWQYGETHWGQDKWKAVSIWFQARMRHVSVAKTILDIGCGTGRLIGEIAHQRPTADCYGFDFSYQMVRAGQKLWCQEKTISLHHDRGFGLVNLPGHGALPNLQFGLAAAEALPFEDQSVDLILSSFLFDRLKEPLTALAEWQRVLKPGGSIIFLSPLNFQTGKHWEMLYPASNLIAQIKALGWYVAYENQQIFINEPMDRQGNSIHWQCLGLVLEWPLG